MSTRAHRPAAAADVTAHVPFAGSGVAIAEGRPTGQRDVVRGKWLEQLERQGSEVSKERWVGCALCTQHRILWHWHGGHVSG
eukprot:COSAG03_NODE_12107_length_560_cov_5.624729_1_plen_81_part_01